jgi:hypothetical protein
MRIHPYLFFGLGSRFWTTYRIENGIAYSETWFGRKSSIPLSGAKFDDPGSVLPFGDITIRSGGESLELRRVRSRRTFLAALDQARIGKDGSQTTASPLAQTVPAGVQPIPAAASLSNGVLTMPAMPRGFQVVFGKPKPLVKSYDWVERGQPLAELEAYSRASLRIFAPVSGVVLHDSWEFAWNPADYVWRFSILMEQSSTGPKPIHECFAGLLEACRQELGTAIEKKAYLVPAEQIRSLLETDITIFSSAEYQIEALRPKFDAYVTHMKSAASENYSRVPRE